MIDFAKLAAPFPPEEVSWRLGSVSKAKMRGMALAYLDARNVMDRLDEVCGPGGWQCRYSHAANKTICDIGILVCEHIEVNDPMDPRVEWIWKADGAGDSDIEAEKGAMSDAFKRAGVRWGIGRYLYTLDSPWVEVEEIGNTGKFKIKQGAYRELDMILRRATQAILSGQPKPPPDGLSQAKDDIARMQNQGQQPVTELKTAGRLAAELWASNAVTLFAQQGYSLLDYKEWRVTPCTPKGTKTNEQKLGELREKHPDLADKIDEAVSNISVVAA